MTVNFEYLKTSLRYAIPYIPVTLKLAIFSFIAGLILGAIFGAVRFYKIPVLSKVTAVFVTVYMGLPLIVALMLYNIIFLVYYPVVAEALHFRTEISQVNTIVIGYFALTLYAACNASEVVRSAFMSVETVQFEAGYSIGLTKLQTLRKVILPQMIPVMVPGLTNQMVGMLKATNLVSAISVTEVMLGAVMPCNQTYSFLEGYIAAALIYWAINLVLEWIARRIESRSGKFRKAPAV